MPLFKLLAVYCILTRKHRKDFTAGQIWRLHTGMAQGRMRYVYNNMDEVFGESD